MKRVVCLLLVLAVCAFGDQESEFWGYLDARISNVDVIIGSPEWEDWLSRQSIRAQQASNQTKKPSEAYVVVKFFVKEYPEFQQHFMPPSQSLPPKLSPRPLILTDDSPSPEKEAFLVEEQNHHRPSTMVESTDVQREFIDPFAKESGRLAHLDKQGIERDGAAFVFSIFNYVRVLILIVIVAALAQKWMIRRPVKRWFFTLGYLASVFGFILSVEMAGDYLSILMFRRPLIPPDYGVVAGVLGVVGCLFWTGFLFAVMLRRLEDTGFSKWYIALSPVPGICFAFLIALLVVPSKQSESNPKKRSARGTFGSAREL